MPTGSQPTIDVLMAVKSPAPWLRQTLESLASQTFQDWNLVLVMDGHSDEIVDLVHLVNPRWSRPIHVPPESGTVAALNAGLARSRGDLIARIDADDVCLPQRLEAEVGFMLRHPDHVAVATGHQVIDPQGLVVSDHPFRIRDVRRHLRWYNPLVQSSMMLRRDALEAAGGYRTQARHIEDYDLWLRLAAVGPIGVIETPLVQYRRHPTQVTQTHGYSRDARSALAESRVTLAKATGGRVWAARGRQLAWSLLNRAQGR